MVFNAKSDGFADVGFAKALDRVSAGGRLAYTETQLYYAAAGRRSSKGGLITRMRRSPQPPAHYVPAVTPSRFQENLARWLAAGATVPGRLLLRRDISGDDNRTARQAPALHPELTAHGFDRVVIVDHAPTAVMLVANNFHIDQHCVVLSEDGYPEAFRNELIEMLNRNPNLVVVAVHGITVAGMRLIETIGRWFPGPKVRRIEVGLRPSQGHVAKLPANRGRSKQPDETVLRDPALARLEPWEREWLAWGLATRLETLTSQQLMTTIARAFTDMSRLDEQRAVEVSESETHSSLDGGEPIAAPDAAEPTHNGVYWWDLYQGGGESHPGATDADDTSAPVEEPDPALVGAITITAASDSTQADTPQFDSAQFDGSDLDGDG